MLVISVVVDPNFFTRIVVARNNLLVEILIVALFLQRDHSVGNFNIVCVPIFW